MIEDRPKRKITRDLAADAKKAEARTAHLDLGYDGLYPLEAPGMPVPGPDFLEQAKREGDATELVKQKVTAADGGRSRTVVALGDSVGEKLVQLHQRALRETGFTMPVKVNASTRKVVPFVPGHIWGQYIKEFENGQSISVDGPREADVMVIGKMPSKHEVENARCFVGETGKILVEAIANLHIKGSPKWYVTNLVKFMPPNGIKTLTQGWIKDCMPLLHQELRIVRPKYILCLGTDASKALLGTKYSVSYMDGRVMELTYPVHTEHTEDKDKELYHTSLVMSVVHPAAVSRDPTQQRVMERGLARFNLLQQGIRFDLEEQDIDHRVVRNLEELRSLLYEIDHDPELKGKEPWIAVDAEWHGEHPQNRGSYVRTIQISWRAKRAACIVLTRPGGQWCFSEDQDGMEYHEAKHTEGCQDMVALLNEWFKKKRVCGHFLVADLEWLCDMGLEQIKESFRVPLYDQCFDDFTPKQRVKLAKLGFSAGENVPAFLRTHVEGGWDTGLGGHAVEETAQLGLEALTMRYTTCPRYDIPLHDWKERWCKEHGLKAKDLEGYGDCDEEILIPYGCLHKDSLVRLGDGSWRKIGELVAEQYSGTVKAFSDGKVINAIVVDWHRNAVGQNKWFQLSTPSTPAGRWGLLGPVFTPDHKILTARGMISVDKLKPGVDQIVTDDLEFSPSQLAVLLGSLLGDGGWTRQNKKGIGFGFGQRTSKADYADWKAEVFSTHNPSLVTTSRSRRYTLPFSRYLYHLSQRFPSQPATVHSKRKAKITPVLLDALGDLGLAIWYQDDGTLVAPDSGTQWASRIYCKISQGEEQLVVAWLTSQLGDGVSYNRNNAFIQITRGAYVNFQRKIRPFMHPSMAYKTRSATGGPWLQPPPRVAQTGKAFCETVVAVTEWKPKGSTRGYGVRYCLTVAGAHNFLTSVGFVSNCYDADATWRLRAEQEPLVDTDYEGNCCRESFWESMLTTMPILEIHQTGILVDKKLIDEQTVTFMEAKAKQEIKIQEWANWAEKRDAKGKVIAAGFNIRSVQQVREFLFGEQYNGKKDKDGKVIRIRPEGAKSLGLDPILDTGKPPKPWWEIKEKGLEAEHTPGTGKTILGVLAQDNPEEMEQVQWLRDHRFLDQVLKSLLRPPKTDKQGNVLFEEWEADAGTDVDPATGIEGTAYSSAADNLGSMIYEAGLASVICDDGRVRTHLYPTTETKRWRSARPNLQNISKRRDTDYARILGKEKYRRKLRAILKASPGCALIEADYKSAELFGMAIMSGDETLLQHCYRNQLKESDPNYYDIHSNTAVIAFGLHCAPTKEGLESAGKISLRVAAKNVIFGVAYGRGAKAIALQCKEEGNPITVEEAQRIIDAVFALYPGLPPFFEEAKRRSREERWLCSCFGAFRRFPLTDDNGLRGEFERQAMNFPIQSMIASAMDRAVAYTQDYRTRVIGDPNCFRILLQIHDALILEAPYANVQRVAEEVLPFNMTDRVAIYPTSLDGTPTGEGPYHLGTDVEVFNYWGEKFSVQECERNGMPIKYAKKAA